MKKIFLLIISLLFMNISSAQMGINTQNPVGLFHIDPAGNTDSSATFNIDDDVVVDKYGNVGVGVVNPQAKLDIYSVTPGSILISDTSEGLSKVLTSSVDGSAFWTNMIGSWRASLLGGNLPPNFTTIPGTTRAINFTGGSISSNTQGSISYAAGNAYIVVPYSGIYRLSICGNSIISSNSNSNTGGYYVLGYYLVRRNGASVWSTNAVGNVNMFTTTYVDFSTMLTLQANDKLEIYHFEELVNYANSDSNLIFSVEFVK